jgi:3-phenylpropionate/trans-cinnamate dioxygenase ferredoxin reductase subunit
MSEAQGIVVIGGGHAAVQLCAGLADAGLGRRVHLVCAEPHLPYQRPPLSKSYLKNAAEELQLHRADSWFDDAGITVHRADPAVRIDRTAREAELTSGKRLRYERLVIATGAQARRLPHLPVGLENVALLRTAIDADRLRAQLAAARHVTVLGGGFIGLEIAGSARALGKEVTVFEAAPRLLMRAVSPELSAHVLAAHRAAGVDVQVGVAAGGFEAQGRRLIAISVDARREPVDLLVLGIGAVPDEALAREAGLNCSNGIVVDAFMRSVDDPAILAIGDCTSFPEHGSDRRLRLESVQNANDQARTALATLLGREEPYRALPWFWSEQGALRLQMVGLMPADGERHRRSGPSEASFSILHYEGRRLACVESVNAPVDHMMARKLMEAGRHPSPDVACDAKVPLKTLLAA